MILRSFDFSLVRSTSDNDSAMDISSETGNALGASSVYKEGWNNAVEAKFAWTECLFNKNRK